MNEAYSNEAYPDTKGRFRILKELNAGGFGTVFLAEQEEPVPRKVVLKVVKRGMHAPETLTRFAMEQQVLALLHHPGIAAILDAGTLADGNPYIALEWIDGVPISDFCDRERLTLSQRLRLFDKLCQAVEHAHQRGVIHCDLNPSNVLVVHEHGEEPLVKVIDFGIAQAIAAREEGCESGPGGVATRGGPGVGTLQYMSPEQARGDLDLDTRADVYSLGILLYELLTGSTPVTSEELRSADYLEILKRIRLVDPPKPSTRSRGSGDRIHAAAGRHSTWATISSKSLRGEMDWIVMKALEKERCRRYDSVRALMSDVSRYLHGEPLSVGPPTTFYRTRKFIGRHRLACGVAALALGALVAGTLFANVQYQRELRAAERERALTALANVEAALQEVFLEGSEEIVMGLTSNLIPAVTERGRLDLLDLVIERLSGYFKDREPTADFDESHLGQIELARAHWLWSRGRDEASREACSRAMPLFAAALQTSWAGKDCGRQALELALLMNTLGDRDSAQTLCRLILARGQEVGAPKTLMASVASELADWQLAETPETARELVRLAEIDALTEGVVQTPQAWRALSRVRATQAAATWQDGRKDEADRQLEQSLSLRHALVRERPHSASSRRDLAETYAIRAARGAERARVFEDHEAAAQDWGKAAEFYSQLLALDAGHRAHARRLAELSQASGRAWQRAGQWTKAKEAFGAAWRACPEKDSPRAFRILIDRAETALQSGDLVAATRQHESLRKALEPHEESQWSPWLELQVRHHLLGGRIALEDAGMVNAGESFGRALLHARALKAVRPEDEDITSLVSEALESWARTAFTLGQPVAALAAAEEAYLLRVKSLAAKPGDVPLVKAVAETETLLGDMQGDRNASEAETYWRRAHERLTFLLEVAEFEESEAANLLAQLSKRLSPSESIRDPPSDVLVEMRRQLPAFDEAYRLSHRGQNKILAHRFDEALALLREAEARLKPLLEDNEVRSPIVRNEWAFLCVRMGRLHRTRGAAAEALPWLEMGAQERLLLSEETGDAAYRSELTADWIEKALALRALHRWVEAEDVLRLAIDTQRELLAQQSAPGAAELLNHMGNAWFNLGSIRAAHQELQGAEEACLRALEIRRELHARAPEKEMWVAYLISSLDGLATVQLRQGHLAQVIRTSEEACGLARRLVEWRMRLADGKARPRYVLALVEAHAKAGAAMRLRGEPRQAVAQYDQAVRWTEKFAVEGAPSKLFESLASSLIGLGAAYLDAEAFEEAESCLARGLTIAEEQGFEDLVRVHQLQQARLAWGQGWRHQLEQGVDVITTRSQHQGLDYAEALLLQAKMRRAEEAGEEALTFTEKAETALAELCAQEPRYVHFAALAGARLQMSRFAHESGQASLAAAKSRAAMAFWTAQLERDPGHLRARQSMDDLRKTNEALADPTSRPLQEQRADEGVGPSAVIESPGGRGPPQDSFSQP